MSKSKSPPKIEFAPNDRPRFKDVPLNYPLLIDGVQLDKVQVHRLKGVEVKNLQDAMDENGFLFENLIQPFTNQPQEVLDALDADDLAEVTETVLDFLPVKMREELERARIEMEAMMREKMMAESGGNLDQSAPGDPSLPTSPSPSNGDVTSF